MNVKIRKRKYHNTKKYLQLSNMNNKIKILRSNIIKKKYNKF